MVSNTSSIHHNHGNVCTLRENEETVSQALFSIIGYGMLGIIGVIGNVIVILVFYESRDYILRMQMLVLAITDLFICSVILPLDCIRVVRRTVLHLESFTDHVFADTVISFRNTGFVFEGCILQCIALDRYYCVCKLGQSRRLTPKVFFLLLAMALLSVGSLEVTIAILHLFFDPRCVLVNEMREVLRLAYPCFSIVGMLVISILYGAIFIRVWKQDHLNQQRRLNHAPPSSTDVQTRGSSRGPDDDDNESIKLGSGLKLKKKTIRHRSPRTALMLACTTTVYYLTLMPIILVGFDIVPEGPYHKIYYVNNAVNVILYSLVNRQFRNAARSWLTRRCGVRQN